jgi:hypothetical protein
MGHSCIVVVEDVYCRRAVVEGYIVTYLPCLAGALRQDAGLDALRFDQLWMLLLALAVGV